MDALLLAGKLKSCDGREGLPCAPEAPQKDRRQIPGTLWIWNNFVFFLKALLTHHVILLCLFFPPKTSSELWFKSELLLL